MIIYGNGNNVPRICHERFRAGKLVAERLGAKIISIRPMKEPIEPMDLPPDVVV